MHTGERGTVNVLVVANGHVTRQELCRRLRAHGYSTETAGDGREALDRLQREDFAAVVAELGVARTYTLDLVREVQQRAGFHPWVMYAGVPDLAAASRGRHAGVFCVLIRGAPSRDLLRSIEDTCHAVSRVRQARCA